jgi:DHA2 family multidrug resistance protein
MHYLRFVGGSLGTAIATNTLTKSTTVHYEGISVMQNTAHLYQQLPQLAARLGTDPETAAIQARLMLGKVQQLQATSYAFQDTFRHGFLFAAIGSAFLLAIFVVLHYQRKQTLIP